MRILIADGQPPLPQGFATALQIDQIDMLAADGFAAALDMARQNGPFDLLLLDLSLPEMADLAGLKQAVAQFPDLRIALMTEAIPSGLVEQAVGLGAVGCLPKLVALKSLVHAIRFMASPKV